jgi:hypothetical protein
MLQVALDFAAYVARAVAGRIDLDRNIGREGRLFSV